MDVPNREKHLKFAESWPKKIYFQLGKKEDRIGKVGIGFYSHTFEKSLMILRKSRFDYSNQS